MRRWRACPRTWLALSFLLPHHQRGVREHKPSPTPFLHKRRCSSQGPWEAEAGARQDWVFLSFLPNDQTNVVLTALRLWGLSSDTSPFMKPFPPGRLKDIPFLPCIHVCPFQFVPSMPYSLLNCTQKVLIKYLLNLIETYSQVRQWALYHF